MFIPEIEKKSKEEIKKFQEKKLTELLEYLNSNSKFYQDLFKEHKIDIKKIKTLEDLTNIPVTTKNDLQKRNKDFMCVDNEKVIDYLSTSGTLGEPVIFAMTDSDLDRLAYNEYISFLCADAQISDIFQLMVTMDKRFMAGMAYYSGIRKLGAGIVRVGPGNPELQFDTIKRISPTAIITVPSFIIKLIEYAEKSNFDLNKTTIKKAVCIGEPIRKNNFELNTLGRKIKDKWDIELYSTYASTEMGTAFTECSEGKGGHHHPEIIIVEFLDDNNQPVKEGEPGEVTITNIGVEGMPLLRFKTGDICYFHTDPCKCGRNTMRLGPVIGRKQQMIKYKGTTLYPPALYDILNDIQDIKNYIIEVSTNELGTDEVVIKIGSNIKNNKFEKVIKDYFRAKIRVAPTLQFMKPAEISSLQFTEMSRKPTTFIDNRIK
ncbi:MAG: AMP-binding protein [Bacteroidota bacterium]